MIKTDMSQDIWEELTTDQQLEIDNAMKEVENGETVSFDTFITKHK
jgi:TRAP-type C4-dicarboxylate transport system substrate-binding protein